MARTTTRIVNLRRAFRDGKSEVFNRLAQICVLYEDLRLETGRLFHLAQTVDLNSDLSGYTFEVLYYIRRSTASLHEFHRSLNQLNASKDFRQMLIHLPEKHRNHIIEANRYFQMNQAVMNDLRNDIGGHFQRRYAEHATANFPPQETGKMEWVSDSNDAWSLKLDLASNIIVSGLEHTLKPKEEWVNEFRAAIESIGQAYHYVQQSTYALVYNFLWNA